MFAHRHGLASMAGPAADTVERLTKGNHRTRKGGRGILLNFRGAARGRIKLRAFPIQKFGRKLQNLRFRGGGISSIAVGDRAL
jgi:hypothetical protein